MSCTFFFRSSRTFLKKHEILFSEAATQLSTQKICSKVAAHTLCEDFHSLSGVMENVFNHSHKKRKDSLEGSLDRVLLAAKFESPKILVPRLSQHTSNVAKHLMCRKVRKVIMVKIKVFFTSDKLFGALIHLNFIILMLICF